jgi:hypothetical protein
MVPPLLALALKAEKIKSIPKHDEDVFVWNQIYLWSKLYIIFLFSDKTPNKGLYRQS